MNSRLLEINTWLSSLFPQQDLSNLQYMQSDASARKYLRLHTADNNYVIMDTKPDQEIKNFIALAKILFAHKLNVPEIIHFNVEQGLILMSDLGTKTYLADMQNATTEKIDSLYLDALAALIKIQQIPTDTSLGYPLNSMNDDYLSLRLEVFSTWYLQTHLGLKLDENIKNIIANLQKLFSATFVEVPHVFVHVDYHCRNLMSSTSNNPGILDFQDAISGPITYDLVSLFQDAYITWPRSQVESWVYTYKDIAQQAGLIPAAMSNAEFLRNFDLVGLQRHIKNLGNFARLHHRDQKSNYLNDMPMLLKYISETCSRYAELSWLLGFIEEEARV